MTAKFRPMKGEKVKDADLHKLKFPLIASLKKDGIRVLVEEQRLLTAQLKALPNRFTTSYLLKPQFMGLDGELLVNGTTIFRDVQSAFMSRGGEPDFTFWVFDLFNCGSMPFADRLIRLQDMVQQLQDPRIKLVPQYWCENLGQMLAIESDAIERGEEGIMLRYPHLPYKHGKASINQGNLLKRKPVVEDDCIIIGFEEGRTNTNEAEEDERGLTKRSSAKDGLIPNGTLGKFIVINKRFGVFKIGTGEGLTKELRQEIWDNPANYYGKIIQFRYQEMGTLDKPRQPIFMHFRDVGTMDPELVAELQRLWLEQGSKYYAA